MKNRPQYFTTPEYFKGDCWFARKSPRYYSCDPDRRQRKEIFSDPKEQAEIRDLTLATKR